MSRNARKAVLAWLGLFLGTALLLIGFLSIPPREIVWRVSAVGRQGTTEGVVVRTEPSNHRRVFYRYEVGSRIFNGAKSGYADRLRVGDRVKVYYLEGQPQHSSLSPLRQEFLNNLIPLVLVCLLAPTLFLWRYRVWRHRSRPDAAPSSDQPGR